MLQQLTRAPRGVTPVVGLVTMIALATILASIIGSVALGFGEELEEAPHIDFQFTFEDRNGPAQTLDDRLTISHESGTAIEPGQLTVIVTDIALESPKDFSGVPYTVVASWNTATIGAGSELVIDTELDLVDANGNVPDCTGVTPCSSDLELNGSTVVLLWTSADGDRTFVLDSWSGPSV